MILTKEEFIQSINYLLPDNSTQQISPEDLRNSLINLIDSVHNFVADKTINSLNLGSQDFMETRAGLNALGKYPNIYSSGNSAFGYNALNGNYNGISNTAIGTNALACNLYGNENTAVGVNSLAGNVEGSGNVGIGNYTLQSNKHGDLNIAIGNGAGYYIGPNSSYKFYLASHPLTLEHLCDIQVNSGDAPLLYGDLLDLKLGIGVKTLHDYGTLQLNGNITPSISNSGNLGNERYLWNKAYISSGVAYDDNSDFIISRFDSNYAHQNVSVFDSSGKIGIGTNPSGTQGLLTVGGNIVPSLDGTYVLGHPDLKWDAIFNDIIVSGNAQINDLQYTTITECLYECKTLHLATSGICENDIFNSTVCGYLSDEGIDGAGFEVHSSGSDYRRDYRFIFKAPDQTLTCLEEDSTYSRSRWQSNISLELENGRHLQTQRVLSRDKLALLSESGCFGLFIRPEENNNKVFVSAQDYLTASYQQDFNIIYESGYNVLFGSASSGVEIAQQFVSRINDTETGFEISYKDEEDNGLDRLSIRTVGGNSLDLLTLTKSGKVGVSNINSAEVIPATIFNVQSSGDCAVRFSSSGVTDSKLQLLGNSNVLASGFELRYNTLNKELNYSGGYSDNDPLLDFSLIFPSGDDYIDDTFMSVSENGYIAIGQPQISGQRIFAPNAPLTIYHDSDASGTISLREQASDPQNTARFGKVFVKPLVVGETQSHSLYFIDGSGNSFNLISNYNNTLDHLLYGDNARNTYGGYYCPVSRPTTSCVANTAIGYAALSGITSGSENVSFGAFAGQSLTTGSYNVFIGSEAGKSFTIGSGNTIIGAEAYSSVSVNGSRNVIIGWSNLRDNSSNSSNVIAIGAELSKDTNTADNTLLIGYGNSPLITGNTGSSNRSFNIKNGTLSVHGYNDEQQFSIKNIDAGSKYITVLDVKDDQSTGYNEGSLSLRFSDSVNNTRTLMDFDFSSNPMSTTGNFEVATPERPYVSVSGDLRVLGAIRFANGTSIEDGNVDIELNFVDLPNALDTPSAITTQNSYLAMSVPSGDEDYVGKITLQALSDYVGSGFASVSENCNHIWTNAENQISRTNNSSSVFIGCDVGVAATGWKNAVIIGSQAGYGATTPNVGLTTNTASVFIGYRAGRNADNIDNCVFIGENAGYNAYNSTNCVYLGPNAGLDSSCKNSIAIGENALRGELSVTEAGTGNIEIVTGLLDNQRLLYGSGDLSYRLNIQNTIAGNTNDKRISIGHATINPDAVLTVRKNDILTPGHASASYIQTWWCNDNMVAAIDCDGNFVTPIESGFATLEGRANNSISAPSTPAVPTSGLMTVKDANWNNTGQSIYIVNKDPTLTIPNGAYVIATRINGTYRPTWVSCTGVI